jgi:hypothetical protein
VPSHEAMGQARGAKRGATSSSQTSPQEGVAEEEDETTSPLEGRAAASRPDEPQAKRLRQTILERGIALQRPLDAAIRAGERIGPGIKTLLTVK